MWLPKVEKRLCLMDAISLRKNEKVLEMDAEDIYKLPGVSLPWNTLSVSPELQFFFFF